MIAWTTSMCKVKVKWLWRHAVYLLPWPSVCYTYFLQSKLFQLWISFFLPFPKILIKVSGLFYILLHVVGPCQLKSCFEIIWRGYIPGGPVLKTTHFSLTLSLQGSVGSISGQGTRIPHAVQWDRKKVNTAFAFYEKMCIYTHTHTYIVGYYGTHSHSYAEISSRIF